MKRVFIIISLVILTALSVFTGPAAYAQQSTKKNIESMISNQIGSQAVVSICATTVDGRKLVDISSSKMLIPASNMKLISTGTALHKLGPDYRFETTLTYDGEIKDGVLDGNVYIIGGGDPTLGSIDSIATPIQDIFAQWAGMLRKLGVRQINGSIIGDGRCFDSTIDHPTWQIDDVGTYYGAGTTGLMFYENMQSFQVSAGVEVGAEVNIAPSYPLAPWMEFRYKCTTGEKGTGDMLYMYTTDLAPIAEIRGTFGVDRKPKTIDCSNKFPEYTCAYLFKEYLAEVGITCEGAGDYRLDTNWEPNGETIWLGKTYSPTLRRIIFETNHISNNVFAETLMRTLGREMTGSACYNSSCSATNEILAELKVNTKKGCHIKDGSGLSRQNHLSSDFLCRFLRGMVSSPHFEVFLKSLPYPGGNGSLKYNMADVPQNIRTRIKVKSGSMNGVRCYSGYILPASGQRKDMIIFSLMINNCTEPSWKVRNLMDSIMVELTNLN